MLGASGEHPVDADIDDAGEPAGERIADQLPEQRAPFARLVGQIHPTRPCLPFVVRRLMAKRAHGQPSRSFRRSLRAAAGGCGRPDLAGGGDRADRRRWAAIRWFALGDTDDNLRIAEVSAWLRGQGWFDLRQYRLDPPGGANIHWSRLVDLPIAGIILLLRPFLGFAIAEKAAVAIAPLLPMALAMGAMALTVRRLLAPARLRARRAAAAVRAERVVHVDAAAHRPSWLAARLAGAGGGRERRSGRTRGAA